LNRLFFSPGGDIDHRTGLWKSRRPIENERLIMTEWDAAHRHAMTFLPVVNQLMLAMIVVVAAVYDFRYRRIPNWLVLTGLVLALVVNTFLAGWGGLELSLIGAGIAFAVYFPLYLLRGMGAGDVKLMAAIGALVGWRDWIAILFLTAIVGGIAAVALLARRSQLRRGFSNAGYLVLQLLSFRLPYARREELDIQSEKSVKLPHGVMIAWGSLLFLGAYWYAAHR
jgi:prepilin peptidase CpaA